MNLIRIVPNDTAFINIGFFKDLTLGHKESNL